MSDLGDGEAMTEREQNDAAQALAGAGLLAPHQIQGVEAETPGEFISIPVPPPGKLIEKVAKAIAGPVNAASWEYLDLDDILEYRSRAKAVLRALGEAQSG